MVEFYKQQGPRRSLDACRCSCRCRSGSPCTLVLQTTFELAAGAVPLEPDLDPRSGQARLSHSTFPGRSLRCRSFRSSVWTNGTSTGLNVLPIVMGVVFFVQQKYMTPPNPAMTEEQRSSKR